MSLFKGFLEPEVKQDPNAFVLVQNKKKEKKAKDNDENDPKELAIHHASLRNEYFRYFFCVLQKRNDEVKQPWRTFMEMDNWLNNFLQREENTNELFTRLNDKLITLSYLQSILLFLLNYV